MRITLVEDNQSLRKGLIYRLEDEGHSVDAIDDGLLADDFLRREDSDLVVLDINLPGLSGLDVLRAMRKRDDPRPVILLTARGNTEDRVRGLDAGADDYLVKPFAVDELLARIRALSRRKANAPTRSILLGPLELDLEPLQLRSESGPLDLPRRELAVLDVLAKARGKIVSKSRLLDAVYGAGAETDAQVIEVYISRLRKRLRPYGIKVHVTRGVGYVLELPA